MLQVMIIFSITMTILGPQKWCLPSRVPPTLKRAPAPLLERSPQGKPLNLCKGYDDAQEDTAIKVTGTLYKYKCKYKYKYKYKYK